jgi:hypothetical protein
MPTIRSELLRGVIIGAVVACVGFAGLIIWTVLR